MTKQNESRGDNPEDNNAIPGVEKVAKAINLKGESAGTALKVNGRRLLLPTEYALHSKRNELQKWLLDNNLEQLIEPWAGLNVGARILALAQKDQIVVVDEIGYQRVPTPGGDVPVYVWNNKVRNLSGSGEKIKTVRIGRAAEPTRPAGSKEELHARLVKECKQHPRVLVTACFALSAAIRRLCGVKPTALILSGESSKGKTATQRLLMAMIMEPDIDVANHSALALQEDLAKFPDLPFFLDDLSQSLKKEELQNFFLAAANGKGKKLSKNFSGGSQGGKIEATPIISTNHSLQELLGDSVAEQIRARVFVLEVSDKYPMFERSVVNDVLQHSIDTHVFVNNNYGLVWDDFLKKVEGRADKVVAKYKGNVKALAARIASAAEYPRDNDVSNRQLNGLAFAAYAGYVANRTRFWDVEVNAIVDACATVFKQQMRSQPASQADRDARIIEAVAAIQEQSRGHFSDIAEYMGEPKQGVLGWIATVKGERYYMWLPPLFESKVLEKVPGDVYGALKRAGLTLVSSNRGEGRRQVRIDHIEGRPAKDFVLVAERIRF